MQGELGVVELSGREVRRNYWAFLFEGGFFVFGIGFVNAGTLLPALILEEGGPSWVAAFMPSVMVIGMFSVPMLVAGRIDRLPRLKPYVMVTGFLQRILYLGAGLLLLFGGLNRSWVVVVLACTPLFSGLVGGLGFSAWQRLYMGAVPPNKRASNMAFRLLFGGITGIMAGLLIERVLDEHPGPHGYGLLHLSALFAFLFSWGALGLVREAPVAPALNRRGKKGPSVFSVLSDYFGPGPLRRSRRCFLASLICMHGFMLLPPFYAVTLLESLGQPKSYLGVLAMWQMGGQAVGNLLAAVIGDRWGGRATFGFGLLAICLTMAPAVLIDTPLQAQTAYAAFGMASMLMIVGKDTLLMELSPSSGQSSYLSGMAATTMLSLLFFGGLSQVLWTVGGGFSALVVGAVLACLIAFGFVSFVDDPRGVHVNPLRAIRRGFLRVFR